MSTRKLTLLIFAVTLLAEPSFAQQKGESSPCMAEYENHNQIDYGPLVVQDVKGTITDPQQVAVPKVCVGIFTEKDHKLVATTESGADGKFSLQSVPPGRYRLVVKADPLCAANVPLRVVKSEKKKQVLRVHMKPRGLDSCSYADLGTESAASSSKSSQIETDIVDPKTGNLHLAIPTGKERDTESGLDNFGARYNASSMGRFMSSDALGGRLIDPQTLNKYSYVRNNPVNFTDPTGMYTCKDGKDCSSDQDKAFEAARQNDLKSKDVDVVRAASAYGDATKDNGVTVSFAELDEKGEGGNTTSTVGADDKGNLRANSDVVINSKLSGSKLEGAVGHEGSHVADAQDVVKSITYDSRSFKIGQDITRYQSEQRAYHVSDSILRSGNETAHFHCGVADCVLGVGLALPAKVTEQVDRILAHADYYKSNGQALSESNQGGSVVRGLTVPH